jgi:DnaJ-class molecular chaperone
MSLKHHPDKTGDDSVMKRLNVAYEVLSDKKMRKAYDLTLPAERKAHDSASKNAVKDLGNPEDEDISDIVVTANDFCGQNYAGICWGLCCKKIHCSPSDRNECLYNNNVSAGIQKQLKR